MPNDEPILEYHSNLASSPNKRLRRRAFWLTLTAIFFILFQFP